MSTGLSSSLDIITFDQNCHHLYSSSARGNDLANDTQIRVISYVEAEISLKFFENSSENLTAKFPVTKRSYSMVKIVCGKNAFSNFLNSKHA